MAYVEVLEEKPLTEMSDEAEGAPQPLLCTAFSPRTSV